MSRLNRGDISISLIMILFITIVSITLLIGVFGTKLPGFGKELYCRTFFHVYSSTFIPSKIRVDQSYCKEEAFMGFTWLNKEVNYITSFSDGGNSKNVSNDLVYIQLETDSVVSAFMSMSVLDDTTQNIEIDVGDDGVDFSFDLNSSDSPEVINFTDSLNSYLASSSQLLVPIMVSGNNVVLHELGIEYEKYFVKEEILANIIACWQLAELGKSSKDMLCSEIIIPEELRGSTHMVVSEEDITDMLMEEELCNIFSNNDVNPDCGDENNLEWGINDISNIFDISIEYKASERKVVVS